MEIVYKKLSDIKPYENNPRLNDKAVEGVANSIKEFGFKVPIVIDKDNTIVCGHTRYKASKKLKLNEVPCIVADDLTEEQINAYRLADNKVSEASEWDFEVLVDELDGILNIDMSRFGFEIPEEIEETEVNEDDFDCELPEEPKSKLGDIYKLGNHRLMCGDSTSVTDVEKLMDGVKADLVFTDPPYNIQTEGGCKGSIGKALETQGKDIEFIADFEPEEFLNVLPTVFNGNMNAYVFCNKELLPKYLNWAVENKYSYNVLIWKKPTAIPIGGSHKSDIEYMLLFRKNAIWNNAVEGVNYSRCIECAREKRTEENGKHPTIKPIELITNEMQISSNKGSNVVDFFGGSGSTLIACEQLKRNCYMMEYDAKYVDVIIARWEQFTGRKAELIN